jgi:hypothetical protein
MGRKGRKGRKEGKKEFIGIKERKGSVKSNER